MTYFQVINKVLQYYIKEPLDKEVFQDWGILIDDDHDLLDFKKTAQKEQIYLFLSEFMKYSSLNYNYFHLYNYLNENLATLYIDKEETIQKALEITRKELNNDLFYMDAKLILEDEESRTNYSQESLKQLQEYKETKELKGAIDYISQGNYKTQVLFSPMENMIYDVITLLPELFFTENGYKYISSSYKIEDENAREKCYEYVKNSTINFCFDKDCLHDYRSIYYAMRLTNLVIGLVKSNKLDALENLIEIDDYLWDIKEDFTSVVNIFYNIDFESKMNLEDKVFDDINNDEGLMFLLDDKQIHEDLSNEQIAVTLSYYFTNEYVDPKQMKNKFLNIVYNEEKQKVKKIQLKKQKDNVEPKV